MTDPKNDQHQSGLPSDAGNEMSDRAGYYDESPSGRTETPVGRPSPDTIAPDATPTVTGEGGGLNQTGTSFGTSAEEDKTL